MKLTQVGAKHDGEITYARYSIDDDGIVGEVLVPVEKRMPDELHIVLKPEDAES